MKKAVIDIDGVLNYYPQTNIDFVNDKLNTNYKTLFELKEALNYNTYHALKEEYRKSNYKHDAKVREGAKEFIDYLSKNDYLIFIITSRDLFKYNQLENTILWLKKNNIHYDYIYQSYKKDFTIFEKFGHVDIVIEDNVDNITKIQKINYNAIYINIINEENKNNEVNNCIRINNFIELYDYLDLENNNE